MPYVGKKPADIIATAIDTTTGTFSGVVDADAGITVDNITIDGTEIDLSSGDLTLDVAGDIILDADGKQIIFADGGTQFGQISTNSTPADMAIKSLISDEDIIFQGIDNGSSITALTLDMSEAGRATFNDVIRIPTNLEHDGDADTFFGFPGANNFVITAGNVSRVYGSASETVINEDSADLDFRVEGNGDTHALFVQGGSDHVGINNSSPNSSFAGADNLVIGGGSGHTGMTILSGTSSRSSIEFSDGTSSDATKTAGGIRYYHDSNYMRFNTNGGVERMRIDSSGRLLLGVTSAIASSGALLHINAGSSGSLISETSLTSQVFHVHFRNGNGAVGAIETSGTSTAYATSSDYRLKENITYDFDATSRLKQLKPSRFNFIADADTTVDGFLAHEVQSVVPEAITGTKDDTEDMINAVLNADGTVLSTNISKEDWIAGKLSTTDEEGNTVDPIYASDTSWVDSKTVPKYQGIDQSKLVPLLTKALQEQQATIETLTARIETLENA